MRGSTARLKMLNDGGPDERWEGPGKTANAHSGRAWGKQCRSGRGHQMGYLLWQGLATGVEMKILQDEEDSVRREMLELQGWVSSARRTDVPHKGSLLCQEMATGVRVWYARGFGKTVDACGQEEI